MTKKVYKQKYLRGACQERVFCRWGGGGGLIMHTMQYANSGRYLARPTPTYSILSLVNFDGA